MTSYQPGPKSMARSAAYLLTQQSAYPSMCRGQTHYFYVETRPSRSATIYSHLRLLLDHRRCLSSISFLFFLKLHNWRRLWEIDYRHLQSHPWWHHRAATVLIVKKPKGEKWKSRLRVWTWSRPKSSISTNFVYTVVKNGELKIGEMVAFPHKMR